MQARDRALWALAIVLSMALLIAPALWNGFALLQYDTGGYLARWYEGYAGAEPRRGLRPHPQCRRAAGILAGAAAAIGADGLDRRAHAAAHGLERRPLLLLGVVAVLSLLTTLPWLTSILLTDIFCGLGVLALYLLLLRSEALSRRDRVGSDRVGRRGRRHP